jgi:hypothetical protein
VELLERRPRKHWEGRRANPPKGSTGPGRLRGASASPAGAQRAEAGGPVHPARRARGAKSPERTKTRAH